MLGPAVALFNVNIVIILLNQVLLDVGAVGRLVAIRGHVVARASLVDLARVVQVWLALRVLQLVRLLVLARALRFHFSK